MDASTKRTRVLTIAIANSAIAAIWLLLGVLELSAPAHADLAYWKLGVGGVCSLSALWMWYRFRRLARGASDSH